MRAFIVRPFNPRGEIDFNRVQRELIDPALDQTGIAGDTTQQFVEAGNIRVDMFEPLLVADLVIADISVHNANVFYELGIRHALRSRQTILIRAKVSKPRAEPTEEDDVPFDLHTGRYLEYDPGNPGASVGDLVSALTDARDGQRADSPAFLSPPSLAEQARSQLLPVPPDFAEEAEQAAAAGNVACLGLLAAEAAGFHWEVEGWRTIGKMLFDIGAWATARRTLERIRDVDRNDRQANLWLGAVYQRLGRLTISDQALDRVLENPGANRRQLPEARALRKFAPSGPSAAPLAHVVVFTGHMVDKPGRTPPRFPESCVDSARAEIRARLSHLAPVVGIAAAASGGDILFHEVCGELGIQTDVCLVMPPENFVNESVVSAGPAWVERYWTLIRARQKAGRFAQLNDSKELPEWLKHKDGYGIWNRANLWMLEHALSRMPERLTVMALWDGKAGDGPGGTGDLLERAKELGATPSVISTDTLCAE